MTLEEKAKAYDKALEIAKKNYETSQNLCDGSIIGVECFKNTLISIFPELAELEDERIRKGMLQGFKDYNEPEYEWWKGVKVKECIAWLEKQGQAKKTSIWKHWKDGIAGNGDGIPVFLIKNDSTYSLSSCLGFECDYIELSELDNLMLEQQGNPTEINPSEFDLRLNELLKQFETLPKEELESSLSFYLNIIQNDGTYKNKKPKFEAGNWITNGEFVWLISNVGDFDYEVISPKGECITDTISHVDEYFHLWSINDTKDGDVLSDGTTIFIFKDLLSDGSVMSYCDYDTDSGESDAFCPLSVNLMCSKITPATKEQHDILMKAIADAGYIFDFESKKLKKIEQNYTWSEEDCDKISSIKYLLHELNNYNFDNWLDSLKCKPQYNKLSWSEEDNEAIGQAIIALESFNNIDKSDNHFAGYSLSLEDAIKRLKSLKERLQ